MILAPLVRKPKGPIATFSLTLVRQGFTRARADGTIHRVEDPPALEKQFKHTIEVVVDRLTISEESRSRLAESVELAFGQVVARYCGCEETKQTPTEDLTLKPVYLCLLRREL